MMNSCRSGVFLPMKNESSSSLLVRWWRLIGSRRMFSPMKSLNSPAEISPRPWRLRACPSRAGWYLLRHVHHARS